MTKIYITKYALTTGVFSVDAKIKSDGTSATFYDKRNMPQFVYGKDFWLTPEEAFIDCERRRINKLKSLEKQKQKIESLNFQIIKEHL